MEPIAGVDILQCDLLDASAPALLKRALGGQADIVLSDMAAPTTGHRETDHIRTTALFEAALDMAEEVLRPGGAFVGKVFQGGATNELLARIKKASPRSSTSSRRPRARSRSSFIWWRWGSKDRRHADRHHLHSRGTCFIARRFTPRRHPPMRNFARSTRRNGTGARRSSPSDHDNTRRSVDLSAQGRSGNAKPCGSPIGKA